MEQKIEEMGTLELKAVAYDIAVIIERHKKMFDAIQQELSKRIAAEHTEKSPDKDSD